MAIIEAYQCDVTGKKFFIKEEYEAYARVIKNKQRALKQTKIPKWHLDQKFFEMRISCLTEQEINDWIKDHLWVFDASQYTYNVLGRRHPDITLDDIKDCCIIESIQLTDLMVNHKIPRFNYNSMFSKSPSYCTKYEVDEHQSGLSGKIHVDLRSANGTRVYKSRVPVTNIFPHGSGIHTGNGGINSSNGFNYEVHLLASEWPKIADMLILEKLSNE